MVDYKYENGRRYHAFREGEYHLPNDENEQDRLDMQHAIYRYALDNKLFLAPIPKEQVHDVLDVGCGTGKFNNYQSLQETDCLLAVPRQACGPST